MQPADTYYWDGPLPETDQPSGAPEPWGETKVVGKPLLRVDAYDRVSGSAVFPLGRHAARHAARRRPDAARTHTPIVTRVDTAPRRSAARRTRRAQGRIARWRHPVVRVRAAVRLEAVRSPLPLRGRGGGRGRGRHASTRRGTACARSPSTTTCSRNVVDVDDAMKAGAVAVRDERQRDRAASRRTSAATSRPGSRRPTPCVEHVFHTPCELHNADRAARVRGQVGRRRASRCGNRRQGVYAVAGVDRAAR